MKRIVRLTESDLARIVRRVIMEQNASGFAVSDPNKEISFSYVGFQTALYYNCSNKRVSDSSGNDVTKRATLSQAEIEKLTKWCNYKGSGPVV